MRVLIAIAAVALAGCETNPNMTQAERDYRYQRSMQILQQWQATQPQRIAPITCTTQRLGTLINTECR